MLGFGIQMLDDSGQVCAPGEIGALAVKLPLPPGTMPSLWNADDRYRDVYLTRFPGYFLGGDAGYKDDDGYLWIVGRNDDIINVAGHRLSTRAIEEAITGHRDVLECAVVGIADALKGHLPLGLIVLQPGVDRSAVVVQKLPKTRSGKVVKGTLRSIAAGEDWSLPPGTEDPAPFIEIAEAIATL